VRPICLALAVLSLLFAAGASASTGPLPVAELQIAAHGLSGMHGARRNVFATFSPGKWAGELTESEADFKEYNEELFERSFEQGVITSLQGRREGRLHREVVSGVMVFAGAEAAQQETSENAAEISHDKHSVGFQVGAIPGATASGGLADHGRKGGFENIAFAVGRCAVFVGDSLHKRAPRSLDAQPAAAAAIALYGRLVPLCS
jgi:hypothetical protein